MPAAPQPVIGLLQHVNHRLSNVFGRSWSAREPREAATPLQREGDSLQPLGGITPKVSQLPLAEGSVGQLLFTLHPVVSKHALVPGQLVASGRHAPYGLLLAEALSRRALLLAVYASASHASHLCRLLRAGNGTMFMLCQLRRSYDVPAQQPLRDLA